MKRELLISMFLKMSKESLAEAAADLMLTGDMAEPTEMAEEYPNNGKRISAEEVTAVLESAGPMGKLNFGEVTRLASELGRKPDSIAAILRTHYKPPTTEEVEAEPDCPVDVPG